MNAESWLQTALTSKGPAGKWSWPGSAHRLGARERAIPLLLQLLGSEWRRDLAVCLLGGHATLSWVATFCGCVGLAVGLEVLDRLRKAAAQPGAEPFGPRVNALTLGHSNHACTAQAAGAVALLLVASSTRAVPSDRIKALRAAFAGSGSAAGS